MPYGPVELIVLKFPGNRFTGAIAPALAELIGSGTIRIIDAVFVVKDAEGGVRAYELADLGEEDYAAFDPIVSEVLGVLSEDDIRELSAGLANNSSVALLLFENVWATRLRDAVLEARGELLLSERIPHMVVEEVLAERMRQSA